MYFSADAARLARELRKLCDGIEFGKTPIECIEQFVANPWAVLDDRTVIARRREGVLDKRIDMESINVTWDGEPFGLMQTSGELWRNFQIVRGNPEKGALYTVKDDCGRVRCGVFVSGKDAHSLGGEEDGIGFSLDGSSVVARDEKGCVLLTKRSDMLYRLPDGKRLDRVGSYIIHGAITDPAKPFCVWGENGVRSVAYLEAPYPGVERDVVYYTIGADEDVVDVDVFQGWAALITKTMRGKYRVRVACGSLALAYESELFDSPVESFTLLDGGIAVAKVNGKLEAFDAAGRSIGTEPSRGEVVAGPVRHPDGRGMAIVRYPEIDHRKKMHIFVPYPDGVDVRGKKHFLKTLLFDNVKALLGNGYIMPHERFGFNDNFVESRVSIARPTGGILQTVFEKDNVNLQSYTIDKAGFRVAVVDDIGLRSLYAWPHDDPGESIHFMGHYLWIDVDSALVVTNADRSRRRLVAKVQLPDGRWQVADRNGLLGSPAHGIYGLRVVTEGKNVFITWMERHRRELVDCTCKAF